MMPAGGAVQRMLAALLVVCSLAANLAAPAFLPRAEAALPFGDAPICSAHETQPDGGLPADADPARLCPMCLLLGHQGAFAPASGVLAAQTAAPSRFLPPPRRTPAPHGVSHRLQSARGPPVLA